MQGKIPGLTKHLIDLSINETLSRILGTSMTLFLAALPLALFGPTSISDFAWVMLFGIVVGTSSSIFIAAPILLFLGEHRLRRDSSAVQGAKMRVEPPASARPAPAAKSARPAPPATGARPAPPARGGGAAARRP